ncbi:hypothetical protein PR002_g19391 [Phytophthora rubi]|uniref:ZSWIM1/3 RNaseH-like domain-containing protein n=1 Tax=Phytophthora rubi TaxID=129364 RepID=A0A6A3JUQ6_9STRA|nr:hypothetical protein PR002_g19391 [Phytophthora rubi]
MGSGARRRRACFGPGTWNSPRHAETDDDGENLDAEMADGAAEENSPRQAETDDDGENLDAEMADGAAEETPPPPETPSSQGRRREPRHGDGGRRYRGEPPETPSSQRRRREPRHGDGGRRCGGEPPPPRHAVTDNGAEADDAAKEKDASFAFIADEGEANAAQKVYGEMSDDAEEMRDESSLVEGASGEAEDEKGDSSGEEDVGDESTGASTQDSVQDSDQDSDQERDCDPGSGVKGSARRVVVVVPQTWHKDWKSWLAYLDEYSEMTKQVIPIFQTMGVAERNRRLQQTKKGLDNAAQVPENLDPYQRTYICTHGWPERKSRVSGKRPRHHIRETDCPFRFVVQWQQRKGKWQLGVKLGHFYHNHPITGATYATYPCARGVSNAMVGARVEGMLAVGAKRSKIYDYLLEHDQNVIKADVDNMVQDFASSVSSMDDNDATAAEVGALAAADPENCVRIAETETGETGVISLSTAFMRNTFSRFGEVLLVDCTHQTNR